MKNDRRMIAYIIYIIFGAVLMVLGMLEVVDSFWSGMGGALIAVGVIRMIHILRYRYDEAYRENMEIETKNPCSGLCSKARIFFIRFLLLFRVPSFRQLRSCGSEP